MFNNQKFLKGIKGTNNILNQENLKIAFYGRSNVGKSSVINSILGTKKLVKSSSKPGKTTEINIFEAEKKNQKIFFIDTPGYGYAKMSKKNKDKIRKMILWFLLESKIKERKNFLILDSRRGFTDFDKQILEILKDLKNEKNEEYFLIFNKIDKLNQKEKSKLKKEMEENRIQKYFFYSAVKNKGREKILEIF